MNKSFCNKVREPNNAVCGACGPTLLWMYSLSSSKQDFLCGLPFTVQQVLFFPAQQSKSEAVFLVFELCYLLFVVIHLNSIVCGISYSCICDLNVSNGEKQHWLWSIWNTVELLSQSYGVDLVACFKFVTFEKIMYVLAAWALFLSKYVTACVCWPPLELIEDFVGLYAC